jgi:hypothetical protein
VNMSRNTELDCARPALSASRQHLCSGEGAGNNHSHDHLEALRILECTRNNTPSSEARTTSASGSLYPSNTRPFRSGSLSGEVDVDVEVAVAASPRPVSGTLGTSSSWFEDMALGVASRDRGSAGGKTRSGCGGDKDLTSGCDAKRGISAG